MARVTVEDCLDIVENRFALSMLAGYRAKEISKGSSIGVERNKDKDTVVALREIASGKQSIAQLEKAYIKVLQKYGHTDELSEADTSNVDGHSISDPKNDSKSKVNLADKDRKDIEDSFVSVEDYSFDDEHGTEE